MNLRRMNWPMWTGLLLSIFGFLSYFFIFVQYPPTRDFPWANLLIFGVAAVLLIAGLRRAFAGNRRGAKIIATVVTAFGILVLGLFVFTVFVAGRWLPASSGAPHVGQKAQEFTLPDTNNNQVSLNQLLSSPINGKAPRGVLLIFYRGYW